MPAGTNDPNIRRPGLKQPTFGFSHAPVQGSQNAFDVNFEAWQLEINHVLEAASAQSQRNYQISALVFISMIIVAAMYISSALWWTRKMIVQPLAIIGSHFDSIAAGNLARPIAVYGRNEITAIFASPEDHAAGFAWDGK